VEVKLAGHITHSSLKIKSPPGLDFGSAEAGYSLKEKAQRQIAAVTLRSPCKTARGSQKGVNLASRSGR
jgi:hypothetical protein